MSSVLYVRKGRSTNFPLGEDKFAFLFFGFLFSSLCHSHHTDLLGGKNRETQQIIWFWNECELCAWLCVKAHPSKFVCEQWKNSLLASSYLQPSCRLLRWLSCETNTKKKKQVIWWMRGFEKERLSSEGWKGKKKKGERLWSIFSLLLLREQCAGRL